MTSSWLRVAVLPSDAAVRDDLVASLFASGAEGLHEDADWLVVHFAPGSDAGTITASLRAADPAARIDTMHIPAVDWTLAWRDRIGATTVGALTVVPPWLADPYPAATTIIIDPAMAFGTGEHATTRGVLRLMQDVIREGDTVADLGAGSAVLSIAAAKLGAARIAAIENDPDAISNAEGNVVLNGVAERVKVIEGDAAIVLPLVAPVRVVLANIVSSVLVDLLPVIGGSLSGNGVAILSGILIEEQARMTWLVELKGWRVLADVRQDGWWSVVIGR